MKDQLEEIARELRTLAHEVEQPVDCRFVAGAIETLADTLSALAEDQGEIPTNEQGLALARFLRPAFRSESPADWSARVSRGGQGLPNDYLLVVHADGYTGGIDKDGRVST